MGPQLVHSTMVRATAPATVGGGESADRKLVMEFSSDVLRRSRQRAERKRPHGGFTSGCSLWFAHAGQEAHLRDRGGPDVGSGRGGQHGDLQHRERRVAPFSSVPRPRSSCKDLLYHSSRGFAERWVFR